MQLSSIHVGKPIEVKHNGKSVQTGIYKNRIEGPAKVNTLNIEGDGQADLRVHGGVNKAVYAYTKEHYDYWQTARPDLAFSPGIFGENLSVRGMFEPEIYIGDEFQIGSVRFLVTTPRMPCFKLGIKMGDPKFVKEFMDAARTGFYLKVLEEGQINDGDMIEKVGADGHGLTVHEVAALYSTEKNNLELLKKAIASPNLPKDWTAFFEKRLKAKE